MEMQKVALRLASLLEESSDDFKTQILARLPVESVFRYRMVCKQWNDLLSSNHFLTKWGEVQGPLNTEQPRLVLLNENPKLASASFCFHTRTWIKSSFTLSFLEDCVSQRLGGRTNIGQQRSPRLQPGYLLQRLGGMTNICSRGIYYKDSVAGLILVSNRRIYGKLCNPYTRTVLDIPAPQLDPYSDCLVVSKERSSYKVKVIAIGEALNENGAFERHKVEIYEPSQKRWNIGGYFPEDLRLRPCSELLFHNGSFYTYRLKDIVCFTIPMEENSSALALNPIPIAVHFVPFPEIVQNRNEFVVSSPQMIKCGSRLLLVAAKGILLQRDGDVGMVMEGDVGMEFETVIIVWELKKEEGNEWVEIARMPSFLCREWMAQQFTPHELDLIPRELNFLWNCYTGVGDRVCFVPELVVSSPVVKVVVYNLIDNTWDWLPRCPKSYFCTGDGDETYSKLYKAIAFEPSPHIEVK